MCIRDRPTCCKDPIANLQCPFGSDFEEQGRTGNRMDRSHRIPFWLALAELYSDGYRYGCHSDKHLPCVVEQVADVLLTKRRERSQGAPEQLIGVCSDLARAFMTNSVFRHKIATHDLLSYAMQHPTEHLKTISTEQLRSGEMMMTPSSLLPTAVADLIAQTFFDFVVKHNLADTMVSMSAEHIQVIAIFLSHLQQRKNLPSVFISASAYILFSRSPHTHQLKRLPRPRFRISCTSSRGRMVSQSTPIHRDLQCRLQSFANCVGRLSFAEGSLGARRERTPFLGRGEKETHLRSPAANQCAFTAGRETPLGPQLHARLAVLLSGPQHCTTRRTHHETDCCMRCVCDQRLDR